MSSVTFSSAVGGDNSTVTDDSNVTTGLRDGGWRTRFVPCFTQQVAVANNVLTNATATLTYKNAAATSATNAGTSATNAAASATAASTSATTATTQASNASTSATTATTQATNASTSATNAATSAASSAAQATSIPQNIQTVNYTLVLADAGKHIFHPASDLVADTWTIPAAASVAFPIGTAITFINMSTALITIAITTDTLYLSTVGSTGNRILGQFGSATAIKVAGLSSAGVWLISGSNLT